MTNLYKMIFFNLMILGTLITISSYSWLAMWLGMEINLLAIIPLMIKKETYSKEATMKYFFVQVFTSTLVFFTIISSGPFLEFDTSITKNQIILVTALLTKMGAAPFHYWFPEVIKGLTWPNIFLMSTWQKIAPMIMLNFLTNSTLFMSFAIISSSIVSGIQGLNQTSVRKIIAYSSINHTGWMISSILTSTDTWIAYMMVYSFILSTMTYFFNMFNVSWMQQLNFMYTDKKNTKLILFMNFLSLGGLPPFIGFFPKWLVIMMMLKNGFFSTCFMLIISTLITLFFYVRLTFSSFSNKTMENVIFVIKHLSYPVILFNIFFLLSLILYMIYYSLF
uniref:NADH-ubiquinone oxidoreductase chain 2 n=1 Tax=Cyrtotrachelus buqueti TaxID=1892066 RepID=A0A346T612_9CUCU|nr:NADH dehydrogenase subunit 2 [Cyrtotrachelus buqueti]AXU05695.1 NADH dehydrogenase subunit 2 [Cyrtotrachelus buqueti]